MRHHGCDRDADTGTRRERIIATLILASAFPAPADGSHLGLFAKIGFIPLVLSSSSSQFSWSQPAGCLEAVPGETTAFVTELPPYRLPQ